MTRVRLAALLLGTLVASAFAAGGNASAPAVAQAELSCLGTKATKVGTARADVLRGTKGRDAIVALGGADRVFGLGGDDLLCGGPGNDLLDGGPGRNRAAGGAGRDTCLRVAKQGGCELPRTPPPPPSSVSGTTLEGETIALTDFRGRPLFVNVWAAW
jgi:RTX calcium-binding nonapeptide repeat (4 copies)